MARATSSARLNASKETVYSVITEYNSYDQWIPDIVHSHVLVQEGDITILELLYPSYHRNKFILECIQTPPTSMVYTQIDQYRQRGLSGRWDIEDNPDQEGVILKGSMRIQTEFYKNWLVRRHLQEGMDRMLAAVAQRTAVVSGDQKGASGSFAKKKVVEVVRKLGEIEVFFMDEMYELKKK
jgi:ribosome-associated toxin RatA of RatAB toxin-antitoxin module